MDSSSIYIHIFKNIFFVLFKFLLQDNSHLFFVLKFKVSKLNCKSGHKIINWVAKMLIFKTPITSKLIDLAT